MYDGKKQEHRGKGTRKLAPCANGTTVHSRLIHCPVWELEFKKVWVNSWGSWATYMETWYDQATLDDKQRASKLQIPDGLIEVLSPTQKTDLRRQVAVHQYTDMLGMATLRSTLLMLPKDMGWVEGTSLQAWHGVMRA